MSDSVDRVFVHALNTVKRIPRTGSARPPEPDRLKLYGLYKQSMEGDVEQVMRRPVGEGNGEVSELAKWAAWHSFAGLSRTEAKREYISTLITTMHRYASTTPEARELVAELAFLWDQVKANSISSADSSPDHRVQTRENALGARQHDQRDLGSPLQVRRPFSDGDGDELDEDNPGNIDIDDSNDKLPGPWSSSRASQRLQHWQRMVDRALMRVTAELAALRETIEAGQSGRKRHRRTLWNFLTWIARASIQHIAIDVALLWLLLLWARRRDEVQMGNVISYLRSWFWQRLRRAPWQETRGFMPVVDR